MKKAKIILILSVLIFAVLLTVYIVGRKAAKEEKGSSSIREQYQLELQQKGEQNE